MNHQGYNLEFTSRRYGRTTFTWIYVLIGGKFFATGDPVQKIMPSKADLDRAIEHFKKTMRMKKTMKMKIEKLLTENEFTLNNFSAIVEENLKKIKKFIAKHIADSTDSDFWIEFNERIDVQFSENDDADSPHFGQMECFAYPTVTDKNGNRTTNTSECVQIAP